MEKTYLVRELPDLSAAESKEMLDIYIPDGMAHAPIRIRKNGYKYEMTKKFPIDDGDRSKLEEQTIVLTEEEFITLEKEIGGRRVHKQRYFLDYNGRRAEIDVFKGKLEGLILVDFEFDEEGEKNEFSMPEFCLADVTQEEFVAGGMLCGKGYSDLEDDLKRFDYKKIFS